MTERLFPVIRDQSIFLEELEKLKLSRSQLHAEPKQGEESIIHQDQPLKGQLVVEQSIEGLSVIEQSLEGLPVVEQSLEGLSVAEQSLEGLTVAEQSLNANHPSQEVCRPIDETSPQSVSWDELENYRYINATFDASS